MTARKEIFASSGSDGTHKFYNWNPDMKYKSLPTRKFKRSLLSACLVPFGKREPKGRKLFDITKLITGAANEKDRFHID